MREIATIAAFALAAAPLAAQEPTPEQAEVTAAAEAFIFAIGNPNRAALADHMLPEGMIFVHNRMNPDAPRVDAIPVAEHLENWLARTDRYIEQMRYKTVLVDGDMAQVWGPYSFTANGTLTHCGVNSISLVRDAVGVWKVANTSFTMVAPARCGEVGADWVDGQDTPNAAAHDGAEARKFGLCLLEVDGEAYVSGPCSYSTWGPGHFMFNGLRQTNSAIDYADPAQLPTLFTDKFVYVFNYEQHIDPDTGQGWVASWNEEPNSSKADAYLGPVKRDGACFTNDRAKICLWES